MENRITKLKEIPTKLYYSELGYLYLKVYYPEEGWWINYFIKSFRYKSDYKRNY